MSRTRLDFLHLKQLNLNDAIGEEDIITREASEDRLNYLMMISSIVFATFSVAFAIILAALNHEPIIFMPRPDPSLKLVGFPIPCIGVWTPRGSVVSMYSPWLAAKNDNILGLVQVPTPGDDLRSLIYPAVYQDAIYFFYGNKSTIKLNIANSKRHEILPKSRLAEKHRNRAEGLGINNLFFIHGARDYTLIADGKSALWSFDKEKWIEGPILPEFLVFKNDDLIGQFKDHSGFCSMTINRTTTVFVRKVHLHHGIYAYDWSSNFFTTITYLPQFPDLELKSCKLFITKGGSRYLVLLGNDYYTNACEKKHGIFTFDLDLKKWTQHQVASNCIEGNDIMIISGSVFNFHVFDDTSAVQFTELLFDFDNEKVTCNNGAIIINTTFSQGDDLTPNCEQTARPNRYKLFQFYQRLFKY